MGIRSRAKNVTRNIVGVAGDTLMGLAENDGFWKASRKDGQDDQGLSEEDQARTPGGSAQDTDANAPAPTEPAEGDPKSLFWDPFAVMEQLGYKEKPSSISYGTLNAMVWKTPIIQAVINTRIDQVVSFCKQSHDRYDMGFKFQKRGEPTKVLTPGERKWSEQMSSMVMRTGITDNPRGRDNFATFTNKFIRDSLVYDQGCFEIVPNKLGQPAEWYAVDSALIRQADGTNIKPKAGDPATRYVEIYDGMVVTEYTQNELCFGIRNPRSDIRAFGYGTSELEMLVNTVTSLLWAWEYNQRGFSQGSASKGILNFKGAVPDKQLKAFRRHWYQMLSGVQNCIAGDSVLWVPEGAKTIREVVGENDQVETAVWSGDSWVPAVAYKTSEKKCLVKTKLTNGVELGTSPDHRFRVIGEEGEPAWKRQGDLEIGDFVLVNRLPVESDESMPSYKGKSVSPEFMEALGWLVGDGSLYCDGRGRQKKNYARWFYHSQDELKILEDHLAVIEKYDAAATFKRKVFTAEEVQKVKDRYGFKSVLKERVTIDLFSVDFTEWLTRIGFTTSNAGKTIPSFVHTAPTAHKTAFLRGFFSADGNCAKKRNPAITISNDRLRGQTKLLLLSIGIRTNLSEGRSKQVIRGTSRSTMESEHLLRVRDKDAFFQKIGFIQDHKQPRPLKNPNEAGKRQLVARTTVIKYLREVREANDAAGKALLTKRERMDLNSILTGADACSLPRLIRFMRLAEVDVPAWLQDYHFESVVEVTVTDEMVEMYDVEMHDTRHQFAASGVMTHNSWRTPITNADDLQWINMQQNARDMEYNAWFDFLIKVACAMYRMDPVEVNFKYGNVGSKSTMSEDNNKDKITQSKERGLRPLLVWYADQINQHLIWPVNESMEFAFAGLDSLPKGEVAELNSKRVKTTTMIDELRAEDGQEPLPDGQGQVILDPAWMAARSAEKQQEAMAAQGGGGFGDDDDPFGLDADDDEDDEGEPKDEKEEQDEQEDKARKVAANNAFAASAEDTEKSMKPKRRRARRPRSQRVDVDVTV